MHFSWQTRLARSSEINRVFKQGKRHNCGVFLLIGAKQQTEQLSRKVPRVCVVVSKRVSKRAVDRNLLKRRFRALYRENQSLIPADLDIILIARKSMLTAPYSYIEKRFKKACGILNAP